MENKLIDTNEKRKEYCIENLWREYSLINDIHELIQLIKKAENMNLDEIGREMSELWKHDQKVKDANAQAKHEAEQALIINQTLFSELNKHFTP